MAFASKTASAAPPPPTPPSQPDIDLIPGFLPQDEAMDLFQALLDELDFQPDRLVIAGESIETKRLVDFRADPGNSYRYSGSDHEQRPWTPRLALVKDMVEARLRTSFNSCLCNYYVDGAAGMGWHSDREAELGDEPLIASLSLGAERLFRFRRRPPWREAHGYRTWDFQLASGDLLLMRGSTQEHFEHELPVRRKIKDPRINLTFRTILAR